MSQNIIDTTPNQDDIKLHVPRIHRNMSGKTLEPYIEQALKFHIIPCIGQDFYDQVNTDVNNPNYADLLTYLRPAIAWFAYHLALADSRANLGDMGLNQMSDTEGTILPASDKQFENQLWNALRTAYDHLECLVWQYLCPNKSLFPIYEISPEAEKCCAFFLSSPAILSQYTVLRRHGRMEDWLAYIPVMNEVEIYCIRAILCEELFDEIKSQLCAGSLSNANKVLLTHIRFAMGSIIKQYYAGKNSVKLQARQSFVREYTDSTRKRTRPNYRDMEHLFRYEQLTEHHAIRTILSTLKNNADDYPLWRDSTCNPDYIDPTSEEETTDCCDCNCTPCCCHNTIGHNTKSIYSI